MEMSAKLNQYENIELHEESTDEIIPSLIQRNAPLNYQEKESTLTMRKSINCKKEEKTVMLPTYGEVAIKKRITSISSRYSSSPQSEASHAKENFTHFPR